MKDFDIELARHGHAVCTRNGCPVKILTFNRKDPEDNLCIVGLITASNKPSEVVGIWRSDGSATPEPCKHPNDLMLDTPSVVGYINIYDYVDGEDVIYHIGKDTTIWGSKEEAKQHINERLSYVDTIEIEWGLE